MWCVLLPRIIINRRVDGWMIELIWVWVCLWGCQQRLERFELVEVPIELPSKSSKRGYPDGKVAEAVTAVKCESEFTVPQNTKEYADDETIREDGAFVISTFELPLSC